MNTFYSKRTHSIVSERILQSENTFYSERAHSVPTCGLQVPVTLNSVFDQVLRFRGGIYRTNSFLFSSFFLPFFFRALWCFSGGVYQTNSFLSSPFPPLFFFVCFGVPQEECTGPTHFPLDCTRRRRVSTTLACVFFLCVHACAYMRTFVYMQT